MSTGSPDWIPPVNIALQNLAQVINRFMYGTTYYQGGDTTLATVGTYTMMTITGRGLLHYVFFFADGTAAGNELDWGVFNVDEVAQKAWTFARRNQFNFYNPGDGMGHLTKYDTSGYEYGLVFPKPITFESKVTLFYYLSSSISTTVYYGAAYALL